jgi:hypothetical protein
MSEADFHDKLLEKLDELIAVLNEIETRLYDMVYKTDSRD